MSLAELEQLITPIDKMVVRYLKQNKNGVTIMDIVHRIQSEVGKDHGNLGHAVCQVLENAIELGFIEKSKPADICSSKASNLGHTVPETLEKRESAETSLSKGKKSRPCLGRCRSRECRCRRCGRSRSRSPSRARRCRRCIRRLRVRPRFI